MKRLSLALLVSLVACDDLGANRATVALLAEGADSPVLVDGAFTVTLTRAEVAFGPAYFCATSEASPEACETAVVETTLVHGFDAIDPSPQALGELRGVVGDVLSVQYDLGIPFLLTHAGPTPLAGSINGHSVVLEGTATDGVTTFDFVAAIDVRAQLAGESAIVGAPLSATIPEASATLTVSADPRAWLVGLDWAALAATPRAPGDPVIIAESSPAYDAILAGITTKAPLGFGFTPP